MQTVSSGREYSAHGPPSFVDIKRKGHAQILKEEDEEEEEEKSDGGDDGGGDGGDKGDTTA